MSASTVKIGIVQTSCSTDVNANIEKSVAYTILAAKAGAQIICHQEMYSTQYFCQGQDYENFKLAETIPGKSTEVFSKVAKEFGVVIIIPTFEKRAEGLYHNTVAVLDADGTLLGKYRKMHIPQDPGFDEKFYFTPGDLGYQTFITKFGKIGTLICWDQWYPEAARITAMMGAEIIFYPTAIGWDANEPKSIQAGQLDAWRTIQRAHAIANGCYVCAVNRVGIEKDLTFWGSSFVADPMGKILHASTSDKEEFAIVEVNLNKVDDARTHWPFFRDRRIDSYQDLTKRFL